MAIDKKGNIGHCQGNELCEMTTQIAEISEGCGYTLADYVRHYAIRRRNSGKYG